MVTNSQKVKMVLAMKGKTAAWLADEIGMSRQNLANTRRLRSIQRQSNLLFGGLLGG